MRTVTTLLLLFTMLSSFPGSSQPWTASIKNPNPSFREIREAFYGYWKDRPVEKGQGFKQFKRWEWYFSQRLLADGSLPPASITVEEWNKYLAEHPTDAAKELSIDAANWSFSGPSSSLSGYSGIGRINCIAFHPTNVNTFWVGTPAGGIWKTTDGGSTWSTNSDNLPVLGVSDIAIDPLDPNIMYIATGDGDRGFSLGTFGASSGGDTKSIGVLKSTNGGATWAATGLSWNITNQKLIRRLIIHPTNPQILLAAASDGVWRTSNGGSNWTNVRTGYFMDLEFKPGDPSIVYASTSPFVGNAEIFTSTNTGVSFSLAATLTGAKRTNMAVTPHQPALVDVVAVNAQSGLAGLWYSNNSGGSFTQYLVGSNSNNLLNSSHNASGTGGQGDYDLAYAINPANGNDIWIGGINTWNSTNGGTNWNLKNMWSGHPTQNPNGVPVVHADKHFIAFHPLSPTTLFECNDGGLYKTTNGGATWTDLSNGLGISQIYRLSTSATVPNAVLCGLQDNGTKELSNSLWFDRTGGDGMECIIDYTNVNIKYSTYVNGLIYKSINGGASWTTILNNNGTGADDEGEWVTPFLMHPTNNNILIVGKSQVYQTINGGATWLQLGTLPGINGLIVAMAFAPSNPSVIYVASPSQLFKTTDGGITWTLVTTSTEYITYIAVHPSDPQKIWLTNSGYTANDKIWYTPDGGTNWTNFSGTLPNLPVNCIVYQNGSNDGLYVGTDAGIFYRDLSMTDWIPYNTGLPNVVVTELEISYINNKIWAATFGRGLWSSDLYSTTSSCPVVPAAPVSNGHVSVCQNATPGTLSVTPPAGSVTDWFDAATGGNLLTASSNTFNTSVAGTYYAESRNSTTNCRSSSRTPVTLIINPVPATPVIAASGPLSFCQGGTVMLTSSAASGNQWYRDGASINGETGQTINIAQSGNYTVKTTGAGCTSNASVITTILVNPVPPQPVITQNGNLLQSSSPSGNQWYLNGVAIANATSSTFTPAVTGLYTVMVTINGCQSPISQGVNYVTTAINSPALEAKLMIAPNPVRDQLEIRYSGIAVLRVQLLDISGKVLKDNSRITGHYRIDMKTYPAGSYIIRVMNEKTGEYVQRIIVRLR